MLTRLSVPAGSAVPLDEIKAHVIVDHADDDALLEGYTAAAVRFFEDHTGRFMLPIDLELRLDRWCEPIILPAAPVRAVTEVAYLDADGVEQVLGAGEWYFVRTEEGGRVRFTGSFARPPLSDREGAVLVRFEAGTDDPEESGSGDNPPLAPVATDAQIVKLMVAHWYLTREPINVGNIINQVPLSVHALIAQRRIYR
jgi:uncharacterized phiE125 gp8 family phage protein